MGRKYSHWTEEGRLAIYEFVSDISVYITDAENAELDQRAKDMVLKELKGN
jgi:hypothetical protein